ncbi:MAG: hypothetical protein UY26_C0002G0079 [Candidatus Jorgensenbacteria bacterium GW2011_GWA1_48_13]|uniref:Uncharacterized protein n=2 Tax=Candidatus Joergenseniibacteriota TaxID=1752739 RepID=A0A0G1YK87_9BACT|nr:MAG: hypothetical protein UY26_C0002G0079 [Candidatus Jorgensenbacteria bacterium GW2011_GWA1_48_13]KKU98508.1 MAG: hypothetical protein UY32_C0026G0005 [Candidatus Jorgensenbacteria bacterium GW2011_GWC1_48_8]KKW15432.1 MAG: hypothetical protein UY55_C0001G0186 [Candidatus Jorgensenbacteria bacterium GW2011_GWB1_50_10]
MDATELSEKRKELGICLYGLNPAWITAVNLAADGEKSFVYNLTVTLEVCRWKRDVGNGERRAETEEEVLARLIPNGRKQQPAP